MNVHFKVCINKHKQINRGPETELKTYFVANLLTVTVRSNSLFMIVVLFWPIVLANCFNSKVARSLS